MSILAVALFFLAAVFFYFKEVFMKKLPKETFDRNYVVNQIVDIINQIIEQKEAEVTSASSIKEVA